MPRDFSKSPGCSFERVPTRNQSSQAVFEGSPGSSKLGRTGRLEAGLGRKHRTKKDQYHFGSAGLSNEDLSA
jgi:hypothetical protein